MAKKMIDDPEIDAMNSLVFAMKPLDFEQQRRIMVWATQRYPDPNKGIETIELMEDPQQEPTKTES